MDTMMSFKDFDKYCTDPKCMGCDYPKPTIANNGPTLGEMLASVLKQKQEVDQTMFDEGTAPRKVRINSVAPMANAQIIGNTPVEATQRDYTVTRIGQIKDKHNSTLRDLFHMDPNTPSTFLELEKAIKDGDYTVDKERAKSDDAKYMSIFYGVTFGKPADKDGYNAAREALKTAAQKALDAATLGDPSALQGVIADFEGWTYTPAE